MFLCECCSVELVLDSNDDVHDDTDRYLHFMNQTRPILELLKQADSVTIPDSKPKLLMDNVAKEPQIPNAVLVPKDAEVVVELQEATKAAVDTDSKLAEYYATLKDDNVKEELIDSDDEEFVEG